MATAIARFFEGHWFIRALDIPRIQIFFTGLIACIGYSLTMESPGTLDWVYLALILTATTYQCARIFPYTPFYPAKIKTAEDHEVKDEISIVVMNVLMTNRSFGKAMDLLREYEPDLILLLEPDQKWEEEMRPLEDVYPHVVSCPLKNLYGMILYSKLPLEDPEIKFLVEKDIPSIHSWVRLRSGERIMFRGVHPRPPLPPKKNDRETARRNELYKIGETVRSNDHPVMVAGDFNDVTWSRTSDLFEKDSGLHDVRIGRGYFTTFHTKYLFLRWPLDHVFVSEHFRFIMMKRLRKCGSDHFPIYVKVALADV